MPLGGHSSSEDPPDILRREELVARTVPATNPKKRFVSSWLVEGLIQLYEELIEKVERDFAAP